MKREAHGHTKMKRLCKRLSLPLWGGVGIMESLWALTAKEAPQGDVGKLSNEDIALGIDWDRDPKELIDALTFARWIDPSQAHRLVIHDWHEHSDDALDMKLARSGKRYATGFIPRMNKLSKKDRDEICQRFGWVEHNKPQQGTKSLIKPLPEPVPEPVPEPIRVGCAQDAPSPAVLVSPADPVNDLDADEEANIPDDLPDAPLGNWLLQKLSIANSYTLAVKFADAVKLVARDESCLRGEAARRVLLRARDHPPGGGKWRFWLEDGGWKQTHATELSIEGLE